MGGCCRLVCTAVACGALFLALLTVGDVANPKSPTWTQWGWVWHLVTAGWGVAAATEAAGDAAVVVAPAGVGLALDEPLDRLALPEFGPLDQNGAAQAGRDRVELPQCHGLTAPW